MKKRNSDIVIMIIGILVLIAGIIAYVFLGTDYFKKGFQKNESEVYQFLSDTKNVYCEYVGLWSYFKGLSDDILNDESSNYGHEVNPEELRVLAKKVLMKDDMIE